MLKLLACAQGHFWEQSIEEEAVESPAFCPVCGHPADTMPLLDLSPSEPETPVETRNREPPEPPLLHDKNGWPIVAGYEIVADLGKGPTGVHLYRARQLLVNRTVTLKVVRAKEDSGQLAWGSLRGEATALGRLSHPNILQILDAGERERQLFFNAVEHVEGPTLAELMSGKPLPLRQALLLVETLARAVHHAHEKKIVHRTLKPASIHLQKDEGETAKDQKPRLGLGASVMLQGQSFVPKIADFGLARRPIEGETGDLELQGEFPCYLAPEQAWGRAKDIGPATDVYALGAILYELISGRPPFRAATASETLDAIQTRQTQPLKQLRSRVSRDVEAVCRKCLAKPPRRRYHSALSLADDLQRCAEGHPVRARTPGGGERLAKWLRRNLRPVALLALGLTVGMLFALLPSITSTSEQPGHLRRQSDQRPMAQVRSRGAQTPELQIANYLRYLLLAERAADDQDTQRGLEMLSHCPKELRHWEWSYLHGSLRGINQVKRFRTELPITCMDLRNDGRFLAAGTGSGPLDQRQGEVWVWDYTQQGQGWHWNIPGPVRALAFSPHDDLLAIVWWSGNRESNSEVQVRNLRTQQILYTKPILFCRLTTLAFSADRSKLVAAGADTQGSTQVKVFNTRDGGVLFSQQVAFRPGEEATNAIHSRLALLSPDGDNLALINAWGSSVLILSALRPGNSRITNDLRKHEGTILALAYDEHSEMLATAGSDHTIRLWNLESPNPEVIPLSAHKKAVTGVSFSQDGKRLASCSSDGTVRIWDVKQGLELLRLKGFEDATGVMFRHTQPLFDAFGANRNTRGSEQLAIAQGNTVQILEPPAIMADW